MIVSNNQESKIRERLEKQMDKELLEHKKKLLNDHKTTSEADLATKKNDFEQAKVELKNANNDLNNKKTELNSYSTTLVNKYTELETKDNDLKNALIKKMEYDLKEAETKLKKEFYTAQKEAYTKEKEAIKTKIDAINSNACSNNDVCDCSGSLVLFNSNPKTTEEQTIEDEIKQELTIVCNGLKTNASTTQNLVSPTNDHDYDSKQSERDGIITTINDEIKKYNSKIIDITASEMSLQSAINDFKNKEQQYLQSKAKLEQIQNEIELVEEKININ